MSRFTRKKPAKKTGDPIRRLWKFWCLLTAIEGLLLVMAATGLLLFLDTMIRYWRGEGLGILFYLGAGLLFLLLSRAMGRPLAFYFNADKSPPDQALIPMLPILIPALAVEGQEPAADPIRRMINRTTPWKLVHKRRLIRNGILALIGSALFFPWIFL